VPQPLDLTAQTFGSLLVLQRAECPASFARPRVAWLCACDCGNKKVVVADSLRAGLVKSCGCVKQSKEFRDDIKKRLTKHGMTHTPTWTSWAKMLQRCRNPMSTQYKWYGARGISVDERWLSFENFLADMGLRPSGTTLDRVNNDGPYCKENCRWSTHREQSANRRKPQPYKHKSQRGSRDPSAPNGSR